MLEKIDWQGTESSNIEATSYHEPTGTIVVKFIGGGLYSYHGANQDVYTSLIYAPSVGRYLNQVVKLLPYTKWESEDALIKHLNK